MKFKKKLLLLLVIVSTSSQFLHPKEVFSKKINKINKTKNIRYRSKKYIQLIDKLEEKITNNKKIPENIINETRKLQTKYNFQYRRYLLDKRIPQLAQITPSDIKNWKKGKIEKLERQFKHKFEKSIPRLLSELKIPQAKHPQYRNWLLYEVDMNFKKYPRNKKLARKILSRKIIQT